jgi:hypothetical protein
MKLDKKVAHSILDDAAEEFDKVGFADLSDEVDYYNQQLSKVSSQKEFDMIIKALRRIEQEAEKRATEEIKEATKEETDDKQRELKARHVKEKKNILRKKRLAKLLESRKLNKKSEKIKNLRDERKERIAKIKEKIDKKKKIAELEEEIKKIQSE